MFSPVNVHVFSCKRSCLDRGSQAWRGWVAPLKHLKVYIKIVKQQLGVSGFFGKGERLFKVLFNDKEIKKKQRGRITGR